MKMTLTKNADMTSTTKALAKNQERQSKPEKDPDNEHRHDVEEEEEVVEHELHVARYLRKSERRTGGNSIGNKSQSSFSLPLESLSTGLSTEATRSNQLHMPARAIWAWVKAVMTSPLSTLDDPLTRVAKALSLSIQWSRDS